MATDSWSFIVALRAKVFSRISGKVAFVAVALAVFALPSDAASTVPDWVKAAAREPVPPYPETTRAVVLLNEITYTVATDGRATRHVRRVVKILRPQGRGEAVPAVYFDKDQKILSMHVWSIGPDGREYVVKDNEISEFGLHGGGELYNDEKVRVMTDPPGRDPGGVVAVEYEIRDRPYLAETTWHFQSDMPHVKESFTLVLPPGFTETTTWAHHAKDPGTDLEHQKWRWEMDHVAAVDLEHVPLAPASESLAGRMTVHYSGPSLAEPQEGTWQGIGEWYYRLAHDRMMATPEVAAKAAELTQGKGDFYSRVEAIAEFTQSEVRYVAIEMGVGGYQPHPASDTFKFRYGDCKDKATLLSAMLSSVDVHSALLMVHTERGVIDPDSPSIFGNHMIAAIEVPKGYESAQMRSVVTAKTGKRYLIFDPTWDKTPFGQLEYNLQGSYGVLMEGKDSQIIRLPILDPELNTVRRSATFSLDATGELKGSVTEKRFGDMAERRRRIFTHESAQDQQKYMDRTVDHDLLNASVTDLKVENATALNKDLTTTFTLVAAHFGTLTGPLLMVRPRVFGTFSILVDRKKRLVPIDLGSTRKESDEFDIALPAGYVVDELPEPIKLDLGFATYDSSTVVSGQKMHYSRTLTLREVTLPPEKYAALQLLAGAIEADEQNRVVLKRAN